jgi:hypothetical protein
VVLLFFLLIRMKGIEGRVLKNSPGDCFSAPPLRPQAGKSLHPHQTPPNRVVFFYFFFRTTKARWVPSCFSYF